MNHVKCTIAGLLFAASVPAGSAFAAGADDTRPAELQKADAELNAVYRRLINELKAGEREKLKLAQQAWLKFRDADCKWAFSAEPLDCKIDRTANRTKELQGTLFDAVDGKYREVSR